MPLENFGSIFNCKSFCFWISAIKPKPIFRILSVGSRQSSTTNFQYHSNEITVCKNLAYPHRILSRSHTLFHALIKMWSLKSQPFSEKVWAQGRCPNDSLFFWWASLLRHKPKMKQCDRTIASQKQYDSEGKLKAPAQISPSMLNNFDIALESLRMSRNHFGENSEAMNEWPWRCRRKWNQNWNPK